MKTIERLPRLTCALLLAIAPVLATAQQDSQGAASPSTSDSRSATGSPGAATGQTGMLDSKDRKFMEKAAQDSMAEIELGKLAESQAGSEQVRQFGTQMQQDHSKASAELTTIAESKGMTLPAALDRKHQKKAKDLSEKSGAEFDKRYMADMVKEHEKDLKLFQERARNSKDPDVRAFAEKNAQVISMHLQHARQLANNSSASRTDSGDVSASQAADGGSR
jgi:putative membrane protein